MLSFVRSRWSLAVGAAIAAVATIRSLLLAGLVAVAWLVAWLLARRWWEVTERTRWRRIAVGGGLVLAVGFLVAQLVPYGWAHPDPAVVAEPSWDSPTTRALAVRACFDCHSNQTTWPWYADVAPFSWLAYNHVAEGRRILNFSEWNRRQRTDDVVESIRGGSMPPLYYTLMHSSARLTAAEKAELMDGLRATLSSSPSG